MSIEALNLIDLSNISEIAIAINLAYMNLSSIRHMSRLKDYAVNQLEGCSEASLKHFISKKGDRSLGPIYSYTFDFGGFIEGEKVKTSDDKEISFPKPEDSENDEKVYRYFSTFFLNKSGDEDSKTLDQKISMFLFGISVFILFYISGYSIGFSSKNLVFSVFWFGCALWFGRGILKDSSESNLWYMYLFPLLLTAFSVFLYIYVPVHHFDFDSVPLAILFFSLISASIAIPVMLVLWAYFRMGDIKRKFIAWIDTFEKSYQQAKRTTASGV